MGGYVSVCVCMCVMPCRRSDTAPRHRTGALRQVNYDETLDALRDVAPTTHNKRQEKVMQGED